MTDNEPQGLPDEQSGRPDDQAESAGDEPREQGPEERLAGPDVRTALIDGETFKAKPVQYMVVGDLAIFEGDIVLGSVEEVERSTEEIAKRIATETEGIGEVAGVGDEVDPTVGVVEAAAVVAGTGYRWPGGVVPFEIDPALPAAQATAARNAVRHWEDNTRLSFPPHRAGDAQWIYFYAGTNCSSRVGRQGGIFSPPPQNISLAANCFTGAAIHEVGHAVGLWHEQSREDRDTFVTINWANIEPGLGYNFDQHISDGDDVGAYDFGSIMHYGPTAFGLLDSTGAPMTTITPKVTLPAGVVMGQRSGLSRGDRAAVAWMYPDVYPSHANTWTGRFRGTPTDELLYYSPARRRWFLSVNSGATITFRDIAGRATFGDVTDGRPVWVGDFTGDGRSDVLVYSPGDDNWWLGQIIVEDPACANLRSTTVDLRRQIALLIDQRNALDPRDPQDRGEIAQLNRQIGQLRTQLQGVQADMGNRRCPVDPPPNPAGEVLSWSLVGSTAGFGHGINDGRPFWIGDFTGGGSDDVLFYFPGDDNWWLGTMQGGQLTWSFVGNTAGFGHGINDGRPFWIGDFTGGGSDDVLFYFPGDDNWWLGSLTDVPAENPECQTLRASIAAARAEIRNLEIEKSQLDPRNRWELLQILAINRQITAVNQQITAANSQMASLSCPATPNPGGRQLGWSLAGNTIGFGHGINDGRPFWVGDFTGDGRTDVLFHFMGDLNWWRGSMSGTTLGWILAGNW
jgi:hypothetical protein